MTVASGWLTAVEARHVSIPAFAVARLVAQQADSDGLAKISRNYIEKVAATQTTRDASRGLKTLMDSGWLQIVAEADQDSRTPRTFRLVTPLKDFHRGPTRKP